MDIIIKDSTIITMDEQRTIISGGSIAIQNENIVEIGIAKELLEKYPGAKVIDAHGKIVMPGFVNTHDHMFQGLIKGLGDDRVLIDWFRHVTGPSSVQLTPEDCYIAGMLGCLESIRSGATTVVDYMYPHARPDLSEPIIKAMIESGIRGIYGRGFIDSGKDEGIPQELIENSSDALEDARQLYSRYNGYNNGMISVWLTPIVIWGLSTEALKDVRSLASETGMKISLHIAETPYEVENANKRFGMSELSYLAETNFLGPDVLAVHCVYLNQRDIRILKHFDVKVSHNPISNMYLSSGVAPIPEMIMSGITVGLATDGAASNNNQNMLQTLKFTSLLHKVATKDSTVITAEKVFEMSTIDGARAVGLSDYIGSIEVGKKADLIILNLNNPFVIPVHNPVSAITYSSTGSEVETVMINGQLVMENNKVLTFDEADILEKVKIAADNLSERAGTKRFKNRPWRSFTY